jgi:DNA-binding CsgD family transcriptional regulator
LSSPETHPMTLALAPLVNIGEGRFPEADPVLERAQRTMAEAPWLEACEELLSTRIIRLHAQGSAADRANFLPQLRRTALFPQQRVGSNPVLALNLALAALWCHDTSYAEQCIEELSGTTPQAPWVPAVELWLRGLVKEAQGKASTALACLSSAVEHDSGELPLYRAHLLADHARVAGQLGHQSMASRSRERSADGYRRLGARPYLDSLGEGAVVPKLDGVPPVTPLTDREKDVLTLVLTGLSYAQIARNLFITQSTVGYHLSNIYAKTGVGSRHRLTELVRSQPQTFGLGVDRPVDQLI